MSASFLFSFCVCLCSFVLQNFGVGYASDYTSGEATAAAAHSALPAEFAHDDNALPRTVYVLFWICYFLSHYFISTLLLVMLETWIHRSLRSSLIHCLANWGKWQSAKSCARFVVFLFIVGGDFYYFFNCSVSYFVTSLLFTICNYIDLRFYVSMLLSSFHLHFTVVLFVFERD
jgi:hypothetical protein